MKFTTKYDTTDLTLGMLLHYLGKLKIHIFCRCGKKTQTNCILIASNFVIHPQIWIISVFKIASLSPYWLQIKFCISLFVYLFTLAINFWHRKFIAADVTAVFVSSQHSIQRGEQDFEVSIWRRTQQRGWQTNFLRKARQSVVLISCWKSCGTQAQLTGGGRAAHIWWKKMTSD